MSRVSRTAALVGRAGASSTQAGVMLHVRTASSAAAAAADGGDGSKSKSLWGGRFSKPIDKRIFTWTDSIPIDREMVTEDLWGSMAHVAMLGRCNVIPWQDAAKILPALRDFMDTHGKSWQLGEFQDDVHMDVEARLIKTIGMDAGGKMHTTRSRNDQVVLDSKLFTRKHLLTLRGAVLDAVDALLKRAKPMAEVVMPSYTHVQHAQPVSVAFWLSHYASAFLRDVVRIEAAYRTTDESPLGGGAIAGSSFPIDRRLSADLMGFAAVHEHSMDATSSRDFGMEALCASATLSSTLSRLAEEFILWSSYEFRTLTMDDGFAMGSSMMPQKKNPGTLELLRGRSGRVTGYAMAMFTMMKGLPSGYNRDFHEDKEILQRGLSLAIQSVGIVPLLIETTTINTERMAEIVQKNFASATELANYLVREHKIPFREAHHIVGSLVGVLVRSGKDFSALDVCLEHLRSKGVKVDEGRLRKVLDATECMRAYTSFGGTSPTSVAAMISRMQAQSAQARARMAGDASRLRTAIEACQGIAADVAKVKTQQEYNAVVDRWRSTITPSVVPPAKL